jgi:hypothetical protein
MCLYGVRLFRSSRIWAGLTAVARKGSFVVRLTNLQCRSFSVRGPG